jgi:hypothetical protein
MTRSNGMAADLPPEDQQFAIEAIQRMRQRYREGRFRALPEDRSKMESMAPWIRVVKEAAKPPVPLPDDETEGEDTPDGPPERTDADE